MIAPFDYFDYAKALEASDLPMQVRFLLLVIARLARKGGTGLVSSQLATVPELTRRTGARSERTTHRSVKLATVAGWLQPIKTAGKASSYQLLIGPALVDGSATTATSAVVPPQDLRGSTATSAGVPPQDLRGSTATSAGVDPSTARARLPFLHLEPSIDQRVRDRLRTCCPEVEPDDDDVAHLIENLEHAGVHNVPGYLHRCSTDDVRRLFSEARTTQRGPETAAADLAAELAAARANPELECEHGHLGGRHVRSDTGALLCPSCRRSAAQRGQESPNADSVAAWPPPAQFMSADRLTAAGTG